MRTNLRKESVADILIIILSVFQIFLLMLNNFTDTGDFLFCTNYIILALIAVSLMIRGVVQHFLALMFFLCFFLFLMGQKIFMEEKNVFRTFVRTELTHEQYSVFLTIIFFGIVVTYLSYLFAYNNSEKKRLRKSSCIEDNRSFYPIIRIFYCLTLPCAVYMQLKIVMERSVLSYTEGYLTNVYIPDLIKIGYYLFSCVSMIYLAMRPPKREVYFVIVVLLFVEGGVQLLQGRRAFFATTLLFVVWYLFKYYKIEKIHLRSILVIIFAGLLLVVLFYFVEMQRSGKSANETTLADIIRNFMISTGGSDSVIGNTIAHADLFPKSGIVYLIDPILNNPVSTIIFGKGGISQGNEYLKNFDNFAHWISFLTNSSLYYSGHGMGSSYLAEVYLAFNLPGVFVVSVLIGKAIQIMSKIRLGDNIFKTTVTFVLVRNLFTLPRSGLLSWFGDFTYVMVAFCLIYPFYKFYCKKWINVSEVE